MNAYYQRRPTIRVQSYYNRGESGKLFRADLVVDALDWSPSSGTIKLGNTIYVLHIDPRLPNAELVRHAVRELFAMCCVPSSMVLYKTPSGSK